MSRHNKTFAPRANRSEAQTTDNKEEQEKYVPISSQDAKISLAKNEVTQITYAQFKNRAFNKVERGSSIIKFSNNGFHVLALNKALSTLGYRAPENETFFGDKTKIALMSFQSDHGIQKSGILDRETLLKMDEVLAEKFDEEEKYRNEALSNKKTESEKSNKSEPEYHLNSEVVDKTLFQSSLKINKDPIKLKRCNPDHAHDYCLIVSFVPATNIPKGNTIEGYVIYYQAVYGGSKENAINVAERWGEDGRINFAGEIIAGTLTNVNVPLEKYLDNLFFGAPKNESAREALKQKLLGIVDNNKDNEKEIGREELNSFLTDEYSKITEDSEYIKLKNKLKSLRAPELSPEGKKAANVLEKTPENSEAQDILIEEFEKFGKEMTLYMLQINRKLILTEAERHGIWLPFGEHKNKLQELKTDIEVYKAQMATIQANLPSFKEQQKLYKEAYDAVGRDPYAIDIHDQKVNQASGIEKKYNARNEIYRSSPILSVGDDFNSKGMKDSKQDWAPDWESFDFKTDEKIIVELKNSIIKQLEKINEAEENILDEDLDFIWDLGEIIPISMQQAGFANNKNAVKVIQDKVRKEAKYELIKNIILIAGGIILSVVSLGQATPFLLAILAQGGSLAISAYYIKEEVHDYNLNQSLYDASIQVGQVLQDNDPSLAWLALSIIGAALDVKALAEVLKSAKFITATAKEFNTSKNLKKLEEQLGKIQGLDEKINQNILKNAEAEINFSNAAKRSMQYTNIFVGGISSMGHALEAAYYAIKSIGLNFEKFLLKLEANNLIKTSKLSKPEITLLEKVFEKSEQLTNVKDPTFVKELEKVLLAKDYTSLEKLADRAVEITKYEKDVLNISDNVKGKGKFKKSKGYHGDTEHKMPDNIVADVIANPDYIFIAKNKKTFTFLKDGDVVILEALGSSKGNAITAYGKSGIKGNSGATALKGLPTDPAPPITFQMVIDGKIPTKGGFIPPATQVYP